MGMLSIDADAEILDPHAWKKERMPVLQTSEEHGLYGPGHNTFFTDEEGKLLTSYHARQYDEIIGDPLYDINRHTYLMEVPFEGGRPVFSYENNR
jgi:GH43 family beta-xylosidase